MTERGRVRIWDKDWNCLVDEHEQDGDSPGDVIQRAVDKVTERTVNHREGGKR